MDPLQVSSRWRQYDEVVQKEDKFANTTVSLYGVDTNHYTNTCPTNHLMRMLDKLTVHQGRSQRTKFLGPAPLIII
jgi:hypothetical protein